MQKKRKSRKKTKKSSTFFKKNIKTISFLIVSIVAIFTLYGGYEYAKLFFNEKKSPKKSYVDKSIVDKMNKILKNERKKVDILKKELEKVKQKKSSSQKSVIKTASTEKSAYSKSKKSIYSSEYVDYKKSLEGKKVAEKARAKSSLKVSSKEPLLAIIIDDVAFSSEVKKIKALPFKVTPSFFPPTKRHPNTPRYAKEFSFYMVHLPLQAVHYPHPEPKTLLTSSSLEDISKRIQNIKRWFPKDKLLNNHTGSTFTSDYPATKRLFEVLRKNGMIFVDSRTSADTKAPLVAKEFHQKLLSRDIFLDNVADINYIKNQLKKAVKIAKKRGYAIAIGHPHPKTLQALKSSANILTGVKPVYLSTIYENARTTAK